MPELLQQLSKDKVYGIMLIQQLCGIPGVIIGAYLVETRCGRRLTSFSTFVFGGLICLPLFWDKSSLTVIFKLDYATDREYVFFYFCCICCYVYDRT